MPRRVSLPGANELFRPTVGNHEPERAKASKNTETKTAKASPPSASGGKRALETARLALRSQGINADRGRIVRASVAMALADLEENGQESRLARLLTTD